ncbi:proton-coupled folate transporter-like isoform X2 [Styela clava]
MVMSCNFPYPVEAIVFFSCACGYSFQTIQSEYIYMIISEFHNYTLNNSVNYCSKHSGESIKSQMVIKDASRWTMLSSLAFFMPCAIFSLIVTAWSDKIGRKRAISFPIFGTAIASAVQTVVIFHRLPLYCMIIVSFIYGASGSYVAILNIGTAYLSDITSRRDRNKRFTILEVCANFGSGMVLIASGYWIDSQSFIPSSIFITVCGIIPIIFIPMMTSNEHETNESPDSAICKTDSLLPNGKCNESNYAYSIIQSQLSQISADQSDDLCILRRHREMTVNSPKLTLWLQIKVVWSIYTEEKIICDCVRDETVTRRCIYKRRLWRLWFFVITYAWYAFGVTGGDSFETLFLISYPMCFTPGLVGLQNGIASSIVIFGPVIMKFCESVLGLKNQSLLSLTICTRVSSTLLMGLAESPLLIFLGSALALLSGIEGAFNIFSSILFLYIYPQTLYISHGFLWIVESVILCIPLSLMIIVWAVDNIEIAHKNIMTISQEKRRDIRNGMKLLVVTSLIACCYIITRRLYC